MAEKWPNCWVCLLRKGKGTKLSSHHQGGSTDRLHHSFLPNPSPPPPSPPPLPLWSGATPLSLLSQVKESHNNYLHRADSRPPHPTPPPLSLFILCSKHFKHSFPCSFPSGPRENTCRDSKPLWFCFCFVVFFFHFFPLQWVPHNCHCTAW